MLRNTLSQPLCESTPSAEAFYFHFIPLAAAPYGALTTSVGHC